MCPRQPVIVARFPYAVKKGTKETYSSFPSSSPPRRHTAYIRLTIPLIKRLSLGTAFAPAFNTS